MAKRYRRRRRRRGADDTVLLYIVAVVITGAMIYRAAQWLERNDVSITAVLAAGGLLLGAVLLWRLGKRMRRAWYRSRRFEPYFHSHIEDILRMDSLEFEKFIAHLFEQHGYRVQVTKGAGDKGIDVFLKKGGRQWVAQVKRYSPDHPVRAPELRDFYGSFAGQGYAGGIMVTTSGFTADAIEWAHLRPIRLMHGRQLVSFMSRTRPLPWYRSIFSRALQAPEERQSIAITRRQWKRNARRAAEAEAGGAARKFWKEL